MNQRLIGVGLLLLACDPSRGDTLRDTATSNTQTIVDVDQTRVKRQTIGNCWSYAFAGWAESLATTAGRTDLNISESYWNYWHWYRQIANDSSTHLEIDTSGEFGKMYWLGRERGLMEEADFISTEAETECSFQQRSALTTLNISLESGALSTAAARRDLVLVRRELNRAFELETNVVAQLDLVFGEDGAKTFEDGADNQGTKILRTAGVPAQFSDPSGVVATTLAGAFEAWNQTRYSSDPRDQREFQKRIQRALHRKVPVIVSWFVDFNAEYAYGKFEGIPAVPGRQGYHMTVVEDYEAINVPGYGSLKAGELETRPEALAAALSDEASMVKLRVKNSWGTTRGETSSVPGFPGYLDLYFSYLNGPIKECRVIGGVVNTSDCPKEVVPLESMIIPQSFLE